MTVLEAVRENIRRKRLFDEASRMRAESKKNVNVYDFTWNKIGTCKDAEEASRIYELPVAIVRLSMVRGGRIVSGLRFRVKRGA